MQPGQLIGNRYELEHVIGSGGMSTVWAAHDRLLDRRVAVKVLSERYASDPDFVERFRREASAAAGLSHPNIVGVYDRGESAGSYYIVMELLPGPDLKAIIRQRGRLDPRQAVDAALQVLAALGAAHRRDVIHRDVKPQNVMVAEDGLLKVTDFGIARAGADGGMTEIGAVIGTAQYLSPEQARGEEVTPASDCYAVGVLLYEMLTGKVPFEGDTPVSIAMRQINEAPVSPRVTVPTLSPTLSDIVMKALEKRPGARFRTAEEFTQALLDVRGSLPESVDVATQVLADGDTGMSTRVLPRQPTTGGLTAPTRMQPQPSGAGRQPPPPPRGRGPMIAAVFIAALVVAAGVLGFIFTDIGRAKDVVIPDVATQSAADARAELEALGLEVREDKEADPNVPAGSVMRTDPVANETVKEGATVTLIVSTGPDRRAVPNVVRLKYEDAEKLLTDAGFTPVRQEAFDDDIPLGQVVSQNPKANAIEDAGTDVTVVVSRGPELVTVPQLLLENQSRAKELLENEDLVLGDVLTRETTRRPPGTIVAQDPTPGQKVKKSTAVTITVAKAPEPKTIEVPDVVGQEIGPATAKLEALGFVVTTEGSPDPNVGEGVVTAQTPPAGTQFDPTSGEIRLDYSIGPDTGVPSETPGATP